MSSTKPVSNEDPSDCNRNCPKETFSTTSSTSGNINKTDSETRQTTSLDCSSVNVNSLSENGIGSHATSTATELVNRIPPGNGAVVNNSNCAKFQVIKSSLLRPSVFAAALAASASAASATSGGRRPILSSPISSSSISFLATVLSSSSGKHQYFGLTKSVEDGEPLKLPESLESLPKSDNFPSQRHRWNTNEEIASMLIAFDRHQDWLSKEVKIRPKSGSMLLYSRKKVRYRRDGYCWKKRKDGKTTREDHMKLKVQGMECIYGCYVHSAILPTFHRRCYWLLQNPDIVLVHYLNVPYPDDNKMVIASSISLWGDKKEWTKEELISQLKPMFFSEEEPDLNNELEISTAETVEAIVVQLMEKQRAARTAALNKQLECGCPDSLAGADRTCPHHGPSPITNNRRVRATKSEAHTTTAGGGGGRHRVKRMLPYLHENNNQFYKTNDRYYPQGSSCPQVSSTTGNQLGMMTPERDSSETPTPQPHQMSHHHRPPLVLSLSQLQPGGGLLIVNSGLRNDGGHSPVTTSMNGLTPLVLPSTPTNDSNVRLMHSSGRSDTMDSSASSSSPVDLGGAASTSSPVSSAVRSLASLSDFSLDLNNGNFDTYSGVQPVTDTMLSGHEASKQDGHNKHNGGDMHHGGHHGHHGGHHHQLASHQQHRVGSGPLLDFRSAFSDFEGKTGDLGFFDLNSHDEMHRHLKQHSEATNGLGGHPGQGHHGGGHHPGQPHPQHPHQHHPHQASIDLNPMDFIEHDQGSHPIIPSFDLDPFDMLGEFSELDQYGGSGEGHGHPPSSSASSASAVMANLTSSMAMIHHNVPGPMLSAASSPVKSELHHNNQQQQQQQQQHGHNRPGGAQLISDYSPEWSWADGETKVLVTGPWSSGHNYQVLIDGLAVSATLIQEGVLRCICPAHEAGIVSLQVSCDGDVISDAVIFEYKNDPNKRDSNDVVTNDADVIDDDDSLSLVWECGNICNSYLCETETCRRALRATLLQRMEELEKKLLEQDVRNTGQEKKISSHDCLEEYLTSLCDHLSRRQWKSARVDESPAALTTPTLLHLTATLNLIDLTRLLLRWVEMNPTPTIEQEVNTLAQDEEGFTPLMRSCSGGHTDLSVLLYKHNPRALRIRNFYGETCLDLAGRSSNPKLAETLENLEQRTKVEDGSAGNNFGAKLKLVCGGPSSSASTASPAKKINEFAKPAALTLSSMKFRAKSVDNTDQLFSSSPKGGNNNNSNSTTADRRFKLKLLSTSPNRLSCQQQLTVNVDSNPVSGTQNVRRRLSKRPSLDSGINLSSRNETFQFFNSSHQHHHHHHHQVESEPRKPFRSEFIRKSSEGPVLNITKVSSRDPEDPGSPFIDVEGLSDEDVEPMTSSTATTKQQQQQQQQQQSKSDQPSTSSTYLTTERDAKSTEDQKVLTLAEQFIAAMPARIKNESETEPMHLDGSSPLPFDASQSDDLGIESMADELDLEFDFSLDETYSYRDTCTPSSVSPGSSCLPSPISYTMESPSPCGPRSFSACDSGSPPCTTADLQEFLQASMKCERALSKLTLSDQEQRELYEAAQIIQKAYRSYKGRKKADDQQDREAKAAIVIQNYYRRYKEYLYWKQMAKAATVIQNQYRTYCEHKRFKKSQEAATCIQNYYRTYKEHKGNSRSSRESTPSTGLKRTYSQRRQHQAAKKIQQFMRKSHLKPINEFVGSSRKGICLSRRCSVRIVMADKSSGSCAAVVGGEQAASGNSLTATTAGRSQQQQQQQLNRSLSFTCCCCCCCYNSSAQNIRFLRHRSFNDFLDAAERAGPAPPAASCFTCSSVTGHTNTLSRKREAGSTGSGVPAKLPGFSGDPSNGSSVIHAVHHGPAGAHLHHLHHQHHQQQQQHQAFSNGYHPHPHHLHHHLPPPSLPPGHLRSNGSSFYGWHAPNHNNSNNSSGSNNAQQPLHQQLPPPQVMAIVNK